MSRAAELDAFLAEDEASGAAWHRLVAGLWDQGRASAEAPSAVPALIAALATASETAGGRLALLLGLLAEAGGGAAAETHAAARSGIPVYLDALGRAATRGTRLALAFLLAHFPADADAILAHGSVRDGAGTPVAAQLERLLRFQDSTRGSLGEYSRRLVPDAAAPEAARARVSASILAPLGAEAQFALERA